MDTAFSGWFGQLTLKEPATPHEEEARFLELVTVQTSVRETIELRSAMVSRTEVCTVTVSYTHLTLPTIYSV